MTRHELQSALMPSLSLRAAPTLPSYIPVPGKYDISNVIVNALAQFRML